MKKGNNSVTFMKKKCQYCKKTRVNLLFFFIAVLLINAVGRTYFNFPLENVREVMLLPAMTTLFIAVLTVIYKRANSQHGQ
jgi:hypothetical protein